MAETEIVAADAATDRYTKSTFPHSFAKEWGFFYGDVFRKVLRFSKVHSVTLRENKMETQILSTHVRQEIATKVDDLAHRLGQSKSWVFEQRPY